MLLRSVFCPLFRVDVAPEVGQGYRVHFGNWGKEIEWKSGSRRDLSENFQRRAVLRLRQNDGVKVPQ